MITGDIQREKLLLESTKELIKMLMAVQAYMGDLGVGNTAKVATAIALVNRIESEINNETELDTAIQSAQDRGE